MELLRDRKIDVCCLVETRHDTDSVAIGRLRTSGFQVVDRLRPRISGDISTNHGGIAVVVSASIHVRRILIEDYSSFALVCVRILSHQINAATSLSFYIGLVLHLFGGSFSMTCRLSFM